MHQAHARAGSCPIIFPSLVAVGSRSIATPRYLCPCHMSPLPRQHLPSVTHLQKPCAFVVTSQRPPSAPDPPLHHHPQGRMALPSAPARAWGLSPSKNT